MDSADTPGGEEGVEISQGEIEVFDMNLLSHPSRSLYRTVFLDMESISGCAARKGQVLSLKSASACMRGNAEQITRRLCDSAHAMRVAGFVRSNSGENAVVVGYKSGEGTTEKYLAVSPDVFAYCFEVAC